MRKDEVKGQLVSRGGGAQKARERRAWWERREKEEVLELWVAPVLTEVTRQK